MAVSITIRDVPQETLDVLASRAAASGRSLQEFLLYELSELATRPALPEALRRIRMRAMTYPQATSVLEDLSIDRR